MSEKNKRAEELLFGKERMTFAEIMQSMEACAKINCEKCALHAIIDGWSQADLPDCSTVLMKNASGRKMRKTLYAERMGGTSAHALSGQKMGKGRTAWQRGTSGGSFPAASASRSYIRYRAAQA